MGTSSHAQITRWGVSMMWNIADSQRAARPRRDRLAQLSLRLLSWFYLYGEQREGRICHATRASLQISNSVLWRVMAFRDSRVAAKHLYLARRLNPRALAGMGRILACDSAVIIFFVFYNTRRVVRGAAILASRTRYWRGLSMESADTALAQNYWTYTRELL